MINAMHRLLSFIAVVAGCFCLGHSAAAQFYNLDGTYSCVTNPSPRCADRLKDGPPLTAPVAPPIPESEKPPPPTVAGVVAKVRDNKVGPGDIAFLEGRAKAGDGAAVDLLAWCKLYGIGVTKDPVAAYWLYRQAAGLGLPKARDNQITIFEKHLNGEQRQQVLMEEQARHN